MKTLLKNTLAGIIFAAMASNAIAASKSDELAEKIGMELIQEYMGKASSGKEPTECAAISANSKKRSLAIASKSTAKKKRAPANV